MLSRSGCYVSCLPDRLSPWVDPRTSSDRSAHSPFPLFRAGTPVTEADRTRTTVKSHTAHSPARSRQPPQESPVHSGGITAGHGAFRPGRSTNLGHHACAEPVVRKSALDVDVAEVGRAEEPTDDVRGQLQPNHRLGDHGLHVVDRTSSRPTHSVMLDVLLHPLVGIAGLYHYW